jgi:hypothetical protein
MSVATSGKRYSETVSSFHIFELPESSRKSALAPLFQQDISFPMSGPFFIAGDTAEDANQLMLRMTRAATAFTLLIDVGCTTCGIRRSAVGTLDAAKVAAAVRATSEVSMFFLYYESRCPAGGIHDWAGAGACTQCGLDPAAPRAPRSAGARGDQVGVGCRQQDDVGPGHPLFVPQPPRRSTPGHAVP